MNFRDQNKTKGIEKNSATSLIYLSLTFFIYKNLSSRNVEMTHNEEIEFAQIVIIIFHHYNQCLKGRILRTN